MKFFRAATRVALAMAVYPCLGQAVIEGTVQLPPPKTLSASVAGRYQLKAGAVAQPAKPTAIVYLEGTFPAPTGKAPAPLQVIQQGYQFSPNVLPVLKGTRVEFPNLDEGYHHAFSYSPAKSFDLGRYRKEERPPAVVFDKPGLVDVACEIHEHMEAAILVLETPHFVRTDEQGKFRLELPSVPAGRYTLKAWIDKKTTRKQELDVPATGTVTVEFKK